MSVSWGKWLKPLLGRISPLKRYSAILQDRNPNNGIRPHDGIQLDEETSPVLRVGKELADSGEVVDPFGPLEIARKLYTLEITRDDTSYPEPGQSEPYSSRYDFTLEGLRDPVRLPMYEDEQGQWRLGGRLHEYEGPAYVLRERFAHLRADSSDELIKAVEKALRDPKVPIAADVAPADVLPEVDDGWQRRFDREIAAVPAWQTWRPDPETPAGEMRRGVRVKIEAAARREHDLHADVVRWCAELGLESDTADVTSEEVEQALQQRIAEAHGSEYEELARINDLAGRIRAGLSYLESARWRLADLREAAAVLAARDVLAAEHAAPIAEGVGVVVGPDARPRIVVAAPATELPVLLQRIGLSPDELAARDIDVSYREVRVDDRGHVRVTERESNRDGIASREPSTVTGPATLGDRATERPAVGDGTAEVSGTQPDPIAETVEFPPDAKTNQVADRARVPWETVCDLLAGRQVEAADEQAILQAAADLGFTVPRPQETWEGVAGAEVSGVAVSGAAVAWVAGADAPAVSRLNKGKVVRVEEKQVRIYAAARILGFQLPQLGLWTAIAAAADVPIGVVVAAVEGHPVTAELLPRVRAAAQRYGLPLPEKARGALDSQFAVTAEHVGTAAGVSANRVAEVLDQKTLGSKPDEPAILAAAVQLAWKDAPEALRKVLTNPNLVTAVAAEVGVDHKVVARVLDGRISARSDVGVKVLDVIRRAGYPGSTPRGTGFGGLMGAILALPLLMLAQNGGGRDGNSGPVPDGVGDGTAAAVPDEDEQARRALLRRVQAGDRAALREFRSPQRDAAVLAWLENEVDGKELPRRLRERVFDRVVAGTLPEGRNVSSWLGSQIGIVVAEHKRWQVFTHQVWAAFVGPRRRSTAKVPGGPLAGARQRCWWPCCNNCRPTRGGCCSSGSCRAGKTWSIRRRRRSSGPGSSWPHWSGKPCGPSSPRRAHN